MEISSPLKPTEIIFIKNLRSKSIANINFHLFGSFEHEILDFKEFLDM